MCENPHTGIQCCDAARIFDADRRNRAIPATETTAERRLPANWPAGWPQRWLILLIALGVPLAAALAANWTAGRAEETLRVEARAQLALYDAALRTELQRHAAVPLALALDGDVAALLAAPAADRVDRMNRKLEGLADTLGASALYVMDAGGLTLAASNWNAAAPFVGQNFAYRPYFQTAMETGEGHHFALGTTSLVPGYYTSRRVVAENRTLGVVVLKVGFDALERGWASSPDRVLVTDRDGMVFITNTAAWRYHALPQSLPLSPPAEPEPQQESIPALPWAFGGAADRILLRDGGGGGNGRERRYLLQSAAVPGGDWTLHTLTAIDAVTGQAQLAGLLAAVVVALAGVSAYALVQHRATLAGRLALEEVTRSELERRVAEAAAELRETENELTQAAKLAALGQMSASMAHEINQPLTAIRSFADNAVVLLERERPDRVRENLEEIAALTDRMASITRQLKGFARRASGTVGPVSVRQAVEQALALLEARLHRDGVEVALALPDEPVLVLGEDVRLQQVLVNLFGNAADAMRTSSRRVLSVTLALPSPADAVLSVHDSGTGIAADALPRLFVPFFTTKEAGEGLGLGLSISHGIVEDFGGSLTAANHPDGGAVFTLRLKRAESAS